MASGPSEMTPLIRDCLGVETPRASAFIVTIYGDVVVPRGGVLWIGNLIECCSVQGISETLVRTAVSRLMSAGRLQSKRLGRKSFYGLTKAAQEEFRDAANILYTPEPEPAGWLIEIGNPRSDEEKAHGWVSVASNLAIAPNRADVRKSAGLVMSAETISGVERLPQFAADHWAMAEVASSYEHFVTRYAPLATELDRPDAINGSVALALRLRLVHDYRLAALADPRLPRNAWPSDWQGPVARRIFVDLYLRLSAAADAYVGHMFQDAQGFLPASTPDNALRIDRLRREHARETLSNHTKMQN